MGTGYRTPPAWVFSSPSTISSPIPNGKVNAISSSAVIPKIRSPEHGSITWGPPVLVLHRAPFEFRPRLPAGGVHPFGKFPRSVVFVPFLEAECRLGERAGDVLAWKGHRPTVPSCTR